MYLEGSAHRWPSTRCTVHRRRSMSVAFEAVSSRMICFTASCDVNSSTCPGKSKSTYLPSFTKGATRSRSQSRFLATYSMQYTIPPFGPRSSSFCTSSSEMSSSMETAHSYGGCGSRDRDSPPRTVAP